MSGLTPRELRPFEGVIIRDFAGSHISVGKCTPNPTVGRWIRGHLLEVGEDYPYSMWRLWWAFCGIANQEFAVNIPVNSYGEFTIYIWLLQKNSLIRVSRIGPYQGNVNYRYYQLVREAIDSILWLNPRRSPPMWQKWFAKLWGKKRLRNPIK